MRWVGVLAMVLAAGGCSARHGTDAGVDAAGPPDAGISQVRTRFEALVSPRARRAFRTVEVRSFDGEPWVDRRLIGTIRVDGEGWRVDGRFDVSECDELDR